MKSMINFALMGMVSVFGGLVAAETSQAAAMTCEALKDLKLTGMTITSVESIDQAG